MTFCNLVAFVLSLSFGRLDDICDDYVVVDVFVDVAEMLLRL